MAFWQLNEPWPVVSWSVIDRRGRPKAAYEVVRRAYQPLLVAARFGRRRSQAGERFKAEIWLVNDGPHPFEGCVVEAFLDGKRVYLCEDARIDGAGGRQTGVLDVLLEETPAQLELICRQGDAVVARNEYDLGVYLPPRQPVGLWLMRRVTDLLLQIG